MPADHRLAHQRGVGLSGSRAWRIKVRAGARQVAELLAWAGGVRPQLGVESDGGTGYLLAQQLVAAGETVVNVPATLASRVRLSASGPELTLRPTGQVLSSYVSVPVVLPSEEVPASPDTIPCGAFVPCPVV